MGNPAKKYSPEVRERAVRLFQEHVHEYPSRWAAMQSIAGKIGCTAETLRSWVQRAEAHLVDVLQRVAEHSASRVAELTPRLWKRHFAANPLRSALHARIS